MKKTIIVYESTHHGNTKKLVDAIADKYHVDMASVDQTSSIDWNQYDVIGIAAGIAFGKFYEAIERFAADQLPYGKKVFFLYTFGKASKKYSKSIHETVTKKGCMILGAYGCRGYDTFGPFKLIGGIAKGHPTASEIAGAVSFYENISK